MLFISVDVFFEKTRDAIGLSRDDEKKYALKMKEGNVAARQAIVNSYLPMVALYIKQSPKEVQTLETIYSCISILEKSVDEFNFLQDSEAFHHHLSWHLRQCITRCLVDRR